MKELLAFELHLLFALVLLAWLLKDLKLKKKSYEFKTSIVLWLYIDDTNDC